MNEKTLQQFVGKTISIIELSSAYDINDALYIEFTDESSIYIDSGIEDEDLACLDIGIKNESGQYTS